MPLLMERMLLLLLLLLGMAALRPMRLEIVMSGLLLVCLMVVIGPVMTPCKQRRLIAQSSPGCLCRVVKMRRGSGVGVAWRKGWKDLYHWMGMTALGAPAVAEAVAALGWCGYSCPAGLPLRLHAGRLGLVGSCRKLWRRGAGSSRVVAAVTVGSSRWPVRPRSAWGHLPGASLGGYQRDQDHLGVEVEVKEEACQGWMVVGGQAVYLAVGLGGGEG